jgi:queuine/archaeosine tRNA-ribosyltransferase
LSEVECGLGRSREKLAKFDEDNRGTTLKSYGCRIVHFKAVEYYLLLSIHNLEFSVSLYNHVRQISRLTEIQS